MALNDQELLYVYQGLHQVFRDDLHLARPLMQMLQNKGDIEDAQQLALEMARRLLASGQPSGALSFLGICKRLDHPQKTDIDSMTSMAQMTMDSPQATSTEIFSLIDNLSDQEAIHFIKQAKLLHCQDGYNVVQLGEISDSFYLILEGEMNVHLPLDNGTDLHLNTLLPGSYFGEYACVYKLPRTASVTASGEAVILEFSSEAITALVEQSPAAGEQLMKAVKTRLIQSMSQTHPAFSSIAAADREWLAEESSIIELKDGALPVSAIENHCCVVIHGKITVKHQTENTQCTLEKNDVFGNLQEHLTLPDDVSLFAEDHCLICSIPETIFQSFMMAYGDFSNWVTDSRNNNCL